MCSFYFAGARSIVICSTQIFSINFVTLTYSFFRYVQWGVKILEGGGKILGKNIELRVNLGSIIRGWNFTFSIAESLH